MANTSLYQICRLCMAVLDRDAIDCCKRENCELRENIEMIYNVKVNNCVPITDGGGLRWLAILLSSWRETCVIVVWCCLSIADQIIWWIYDENMSSMQRYCGHEHDAVYSGHGNTDQYTGDTPFAAWYQCFGMCISHVIPLNGEFKVERISIKFQFFMSYRSWRKAIRWRARNGHDVKCKSVQFQNDREQYSVRNIRSGEMVSGNW